jgi:hypothetical protein
VVRANSLRELAGRGAYSKIMRWLEVGIPIFTKQPDMLRKKKF